MDEQAFRRERLLASGLLREPPVAELALLRQVVQAQAAQRPAPRPMRDGGEAACSSGLVPARMPARLR